jgi:cellulose biosynthesis protein BcsQ
VWSPSAPDPSINQELHQRCGLWWSDQVLHVNAADQVTRDLYDQTLNEARVDGEQRRLHVLDRHRTRTGWFVSEKQPLWAAPNPHAPIVVFYSFKGGLGRSTLLASFAIQRSGAGERVCVLDLDLDSPGVGRLLSSDMQGLTARWGIVDFLLEQAVGEPPLSDYYHRCDRVAGKGEIIVFPSGRMNDAYPDKLARIDMEEAIHVRETGIAKLLTRARDELKPKWILLDARTGISESAGRLLAGIAHIHVLLGTTNDQSWLGLSLILDRLGKERILAGHPQAEVALVHAMVPVGEAGKIAQEQFRSRAEREFTDRYYAEAKDEDSSDTAIYWDTRDLDSLDAPHVPVHIEYEPKLASFTDIREVSESLSTGPYATIAERIMSRFILEPGA